MATAASLGTTIFLLTVLILQSHCLPIDARHSQFDIGICHRASRAVESGIILFDHLIGAGEKREQHGKPSGRRRTTRALRLEPRWVLRSRPEVFGHQNFRNYGKSARQRANRSETSAIQ